ncbi:MAG TPA: tRNA epoxyqueuosine(34) reductase QueG [Thermoanaerobaculia bacterium]|nr:tRNA epoxyqueuosine(34) reductase QueG [Thermoanaerobaculia bacterium]
MLAWPQNGSFVASAGPFPVSAPDRLLAAAVLREEARRESFSRVGFAKAERPAGFDRFESWIAAGRHAGMNYLEKTRETRSSPERLLPGARTVVCLAARHGIRPVLASDGAQLARYALGADYHGTLRQRATRVARAAARRIGPFRFRVCVDSTPLAERSFAAAAGLGWIGKNGCLIDAEHGSYLLLAEIVTDLDLPPDEPVAERCGSCARCLEACPTEAFLGPGLLDAARCLAYWTIEHRGPLDDAIREKVGQRVFGCDICQEVCPWNNPLPPAETERARSGQAAAKEDPPPTRREWLEMGPGQWRRRWGATALNRAGRRGMQRNAAASAGACADSSCLPALQRTARVSEAGLSDASLWALGRLGPPDPPDPARRKDL